MREGRFWVVLGMVLAIAMTTSLDPSQNQSGALNAAFVGLLLLLAFGMELAGLRLWMDMAQMALGLWLAVSPFALRYTSTAYVTVAHILLGLLLAVLGAHQLLQRWRA